MGPVFSPVLKAGCIQAKVSCTENMVY